VRAGAYSEIRLSIKSLEKQSPDEALSFARAMLVPD